MYGGIRYKFYSTKVKDKNSMVLLVDGLGFVEKKKNVHRNFATTEYVINQ